GGAIVFDSNCMHGSGGNITPYPRSNIFIVFNSVENTCTKPFSANNTRPEFLAARDFTPVGRCGHEVTASTHRGSAPPLAMKPGGWCLPVPLWYGRLPQQTGRGRPKSLRGYLVKEPTRTPPRAPWARRVAGRSESTSTLVYDIPKWSPHGIRTMARQRPRATRSATSTSGRLRLLTPLITNTEPARRPL